MVTAKRLYLYGVMGVALVPLLWGSWSILRLAARAIGAAVGDREAIGADVARNELSLAIALLVVAVPVWLIHAWLAQRSLRGSEVSAGDERGSAARSTYFFLVLLITGGVALATLYEVVQQVGGSVLTGWRPWGLAGALAALLVATAAWAGHVIWRGTDLRAAPARTANDWLTRAYLYGGLFILALLLAFWLGQVVAIIVSELGSARQYWDPWEEAIPSALGGTAGTAAGWVVLWVLAWRLVRAGPPMGTAHRASRTRTAYFLGVLLVSTAATLALVSLGGRHILAEALGVWRPSEGSRLAADVSGPLIMAVFFVILGWWHRRQALREAAAFGGPARREAVWRGGLYILSFAGLAALAVGTAWSVYGIIEYFAASSGFEQSIQLREEATPGLATALAGLVVWAPTWRLVRRDHAADPARSAAAFPRRVYLLLVSAIAVVVVMGSLAYLTYQAIRLFIGEGPIDDPAWGVSATVVAGVVLAYHLLLLRADASTLATAEASAERLVGAPGAAQRVTETIEISVSPGSDLEVLNAAIRAALPDDAELRVVDRPDRGEQSGGPDA